MLLTTNQPIRHRFFLAMGVPCVPLGMEGLEVDLQDTSVAVELGDNCWAGEANQGMVLV